MSYNTKEIKVKIATDKLFRSIYWVPTQEELRQTVAEALKFFEEQFPSVSFNLHSKEEVWDSQGYPTMLDFPFSLIMDLPNVSSFKAMIKILIQRAKDAGFRKESRICDEEEWKHIIRKNKNRSKQSQFLYLWGYFDRFFSTEMLFDLKKKISHEDREIVLGFTARFFVIMNPFGGCSGMAEIGGNYAVFPVQMKKLKPTHAILHEIGHLFGAQHIEKEEGLSIMNPTPDYGENYLFDPDNVKRINDHIERL